MLSSTHGAAPQAQRCRPEGRTAIAVRGEHHSAGQSHRCGGRQRTALAVRGEHQGAGQDATAAAGAQADGAHLRVAAVGGARRNAVRGSAEARTGTPGACPTHPPERDIP